MLNQRFRTHSDGLRPSKVTVSALLVLGVVLAALQREVAAQTVFDYRFCPFDDGTAIDDDRVDVALNGTSLFENYSLPGPREVECRTGAARQGRNELTIHADNVGTPPVFSDGSRNVNTAALVIRSTRGEVLDRNRWDLPANRTATWIVCAVSEDELTIHTEPSFGNGGIADQSYVQHRAIPELRLPEATGCDDQLHYSLSPQLPAGLSFDPSTRVLSGSPTVGSPSRIYT